MPLNLITLLLLLSFSSKCFAELNTLNALSEISTRPIVKALVDAPGFVALAAENGYKAERHNVTTEDGYILVLHRILPRGHCARKKPVLLMHGILQASEDMISAGPSTPGFVLADQCFDVWCGNVRGNRNTRSHISLDPDKDLEFWKFSIDEMGLYDTPAMIDYVLKQTNSEKLIYIGFSQAGGSLFIMNSERPEYAAKVALFVGLAPSTRILHTRSATIKAVLRGVQTFQAQLDSYGVWEVLREGSPLTGPLNVLCQARLVAAILCETVTGLLDSLHPESITPEVETRIIKYFTAGTSVTNLVWFAQALESEKFVKMDYGSVKNLELYGSSEPPEYDFKASDVPTVIFHGLSDHIVDTKDVEWFVPQLPHLLEYIQVEDPLWNHFDMTYSRFWNESIFKPMKKYLLEYADL